MSESYSEESYSDSEEIKTKYVCEEPCSSVLDYDLDKTTKELFRKCVACHRRYPVNPSEYIISSKDYYQDGEENLTETINFNMMANNVTIKTVYFDCEKCNKKQKAKFWRSDKTMIANYLCLHCKTLSH